MASEPISPAHLAVGLEIDGFIVGEQLHQGGMATIWRVHRCDDSAADDATLPLVMKVPRIRGGEVHFEGQDLMKASPEALHPVGRGPYRRTIESATTGEGRAADLRNCLRGTFRCRSS